MSALRRSRPTPLDRLLGSRFVAALASPRHVDDYLQLVDPAWSVRECRARVVEVRSEADDVVTLVLAPNGRFAGHRAGQWLSLTAEVHGVRTTRCFSIASAPSEGGNIALTLRVRPDGALSRWVGHEAAPGDVVILGEPQGDFVLPEPTPERLLLVSGGTGITPCASILRDVIARSPRTAVTFVHFARSYAAVPFLEELRALAAEHPQLRLVLSLTREAPAAGDFSGHLDDTMLATIAADVMQDPTSHVYVCGPDGLVEAMRSRAGTHAETGRLHVERFTAPTKTSVDVVDDTSPRRLVFRASGRIASGDARRSLLVQAEEAGLSPEHGCRMGICHSCRCGKSAGVVRDLVSGELLDDSVTEIRLCVSAPVTDVTLDL